MDAARCGVEKHLNFSALGDDGLSKFALKMHHTEPNKCPILLMLLLLQTTIHTTKLKIKSQRACEGNRKM